MSEKAVWGGQYLAAHRNSKNGSGKFRLYYYGLIPKSEQQLSVIENFPYDFPVFK